LRRHEQLAIIARMEGDSKRSRENTGQLVVPEAAESMNGPVPVRSPAAPD
jgi:hypothetical protein